MLGAVLVGIVVSACSGGGGEPSLGDPSAPTTTEQPRAGGVLRVGIERPASLDPARVRTASEAIAVDLLYDGLTAVDADGRIVPALADRWSATPDQRRWDFHVRGDAAFSNARTITPEDVRASLERVRAEGTDLLKSALATVTAITAPAPDLVHVELSEPLADLPSVLAGPGFGVVAPGDLGVASGPFVLRSRDDDVVTLVRARDGVHLDGVELRLADPAASFEALEAGRLDVSVVPSSASEEAAERFGRGGFVPYTAVVFYGFNLKSPKFADVRFREAIMRAIDRRAIASVVYGGVVQPIDGPVPRGLPEFQSRPCGSRCEHSVATARSLLAAAFPPPSAPPTIAIDFDADSTQESVAKAIQANLADVGVKADLRPHPVDAYPAFVGRGEQELFRLGWVGLYPAADAFLTPLFRSGSETNVTGFSAAAVDDVLRAARAEGDAARRIELYRDAERRIMDLVPIVPIAQFETLSAAAPRVRGLRWTPGGTFDGSRVWLAGS